MSLSYQEKLEKGYEIWTRNMTIKPAALVCLTFKHMGTQQLVKIPPGRFPYRLYPGIVSKEMIAQGGGQLGHFINTGALKLITKKQALAMLEEPGAKEEQAALFHRANNDAAAQKWAKDQKKQADGIASANPTQDEYVAGPPGLPDHIKLGQDPMAALQERLKSSGDGPSKARFQLAQASAAPNVNPKVLGIMTRWSNETDEGVLMDLKAMRSQLQPLDLQYVIGACQRKCRTWNWAQRLVETTYEASA